MADTKRCSQLIEADDRRIVPALLKAVDVLLAKPGKLRELLLVQTLLLPDLLTFRPTSLRMSMRRGQRIAREFVTYSMYSCTVDKIPLDEPTILRVLAPRRRYQLLDYWDH